jgi:hypothetical protein
MDLTLSVYTSNIESLLSIFEDSEKVRIEKRKKLEAEFEKNEGWSKSDFENYTHYRSHFEWLLMHSLYVTGFSYFENYLRSISKQIEQKSNSKVKLNDISGNGSLDRYRKFIFLVGEIEFANSNSKIWHKMLEFKTIRNSIIHHYGQIDKHIELVEKHNLFFGPSKKMIRIKNIDFLRDFCETSVEYMTGISEEIKKNYSS